MLVVALFGLTVELRVACVSSKSVAASVVTLGALAHDEVDTSALLAESVLPVALFALILYLYIVLQVSPVSDLGDVTPAVIWAKVLQPVPVQRQRSYDAAPPVGAVQDTEIDV